ncbi:Ankyrin repeat protein 1 [Giardia muris]|uniref:Ankyrin repeat protein 1 n=1 Tax=Giardia muris TaxID=5742 RepID=A0A4Z1SXJ9_GIAMU|nr:Ankyrin repeat protein 1 [Giardia muris]|eukprot:TNJ30444.1 Ankyrin repeat protein 1 [Giardia muris]
MSKAWFEAIEGRRFDDIRTLAPQFATTTDIYGETGLMKAVLYNDRSIVDVLLPLETGLVSTAGYTALALAASINNPDLCTLLLPLEGSVPLAGRRTPLMYAAGVGALDAVKILLSSFSLSEHDDQGLTALAYAARANSLDCVKLLLEQTTVETPDICLALKSAGEEVTDVLVDTIMKRQTASAPSAIQLPEELEKMRTELAQRMEELAKLQQRVLDLEAEKVAQQEKIYDLEGMALKANMTNFSNDPLETTDKEGKEIPLEFRFNRLSLAYTSLLQRVDAYKTELLHFRERQVAPALSLVDVSTPRMNDQDRAYLQSICCDLARTAKEMDAEKIRHNITELHSRTLQLLEGVSDMQDRCTHELSFAKEPIVPSAPALQRTESRSELSDTSDTARSETKQLSKLREALKKRVNENKELQAKVKELEKKVVTLEQEVANKEWSTSVINMRQSGSPARATRIASDTTANSPYRRNVFRSSSGIGKREDEELEFGTPNFGRSLVASGTSRSGSMSELTEDYFSYLNSFIGSTGTTPDTEARIALRITPDTSYNPELTNSILSLRPEDADTEASHKHTHSSAGALKDKITELKERMAKMGKKKPSMEGINKLTAALSKAQVLLESREKEVREARHKIHDLERKLALAEKSSQATDAYTKLLRAKDIEILRLQRILTEENGIVTKHVLAECTKNLDTLPSGPLGRIYSRRGKAVRIIDINSLDNDANQLNSLREQLAQQDSALRATRESEVKLRDQITELKRTRDEAEKKRDADMSEVMSKLVAKIQEITALKGELEKAKEVQNTLLAEKAHLEEAHKMLEERVANLQKQLDDAVSSMGDLTASEARGYATSDELHQLALKLANKSSELVEADKRIDTLQATITDLARRMDTASSQLLVRETEVDNLQLIIRSHEAQIARQQALIATLKDERNIELLEQDNMPASGYSTKRPMDLLDISQETMNDGEYYDARSRSRSTRSYVGSVTRLGTPSFSETPLDRSWRATSSPLRAENLSSRSHVSSELDSDITRIRVSKQPVQDGIVISTEGITEGFGGLDLTAPLEFSAVSGSRVVKKSMLIDPLPKAPPATDYTELYNTYLDSTNADGNTPLMQAVLRQDTLAVRRFLNYAKQVNRKGETALMLAIVTGNREIIQILMELEAGHILPDGDCALQRCLIAGYVDLANILAEEEGLDVAELLATTDGPPEILNAAAERDIVKVWSLIPYQRGSNDATGRTAMMLAAEIGSPSIVRILMPYEARMRNQTGRTALMLASTRNQAECVGVLVKRESRLQSYDGKTALMYAAAYDSIDCIAILLEYEAGMRATTESGDGPGYTALMVAANRGNIRALKMLLPYELDIPDSRGRYVASYAKKPEIRQILSC